MELHAEQLTVSTRKVVRTVQVHRRTSSRDALVQEALHNTGVEIERIAVGRFVDAVPPIREEGDVTILPVIEEVVVVERRLRLVEEVRIRRVQTTAAHTETVTLREQHVHVDWSDPVPSAAPDPAIAAPIPHAEYPARRVSMSNETIVAVFDSEAHAEQAVKDLIAAKVPETAIHRHTAEGSYSAEATSVTTRRTDSDTGGFWSNIFGGSTDDHPVYDHTLQNGGNVVSVTTVPDHDYESVMAILERHNPVDIDERAATYGATTGATTGAMASTTAKTAPAMTTAPATTDRDGVIQLAEESMAVGKRVVNRGGTRVRRYVVETPFQQDVSLHEEKVTLERRPVTDGRAVTDADFTDKTIEMTETAEEAVVSKSARVVEEVALNKTSTDRTETIRDTLRKEEVEIEQIPGSATTTSTTSGFTKKV